MYVIPLRTDTILSPLLRNMSRSFRISKVYLLGFILIAWPLTTFAEFDKTLTYRNLDYDSIMCEFIRTHTNDIRPSINLYGTPARARLYMKIRRSEFSKFSQNGEVRVFGTKHFDQRLADIVNRRLEDKAMSGVPYWFQAIGPSAIALAAPTAGGSIILGVGSSLVIGRYDTQAKVASTNALARGRVREGDIVVYAMRTFVRDSNEWFGHYFSFLRDGNEATPIFCGAEYPVKLID